MPFPNWMTPDIRKKIDDRVKDLTESFALFRHEFYEEQKQQGNNASGLFLNLSLVREVVERYFEALEKERIEHRCGLFNGYRQAAFTIRWWMQLRPIQTSVDLRPYLTANEDFCLSIAFRMLKVDEENIHPKIYELLAYSLRFDRLEEGLLLTLCTQLNPSLAKLHVEETLAERA